MLPESVSSAVNSRGGLFIVMAGPAVAYMVGGLGMHLGWALALTSVAWSLLDMLSTASSSWFRSAKPIKTYLWKLQAGRQRAQAAQRRAEVEQRLAEVRFEFSVKIDATKGQAAEVGIHLQPMGDELSGWEVSGIVPGKLLDQYNRKAAKKGGMPQVQPGDRLVAVNCDMLPRNMQQSLKDFCSTERKSPCVVLLLSRAGEDAGRQITDVQVERREQEAWGMELEAHTSMTLGETLRVKSVEPSSAVGRWNSSAAGREQGQIQEGDWLVACDGEMGRDDMLRKFKDADRLSMVLLRFGGAATPPTSQTKGESVTPTSSF